MDMIRVVLGGYLYRDLYLKSYDIGFKITLSFKAMKGGAVCLILEPLRTFTSSFIEMKTAGKVLVCPPAPPPPLPLSHDFAPSHDFLIETSRIPTC